MLSLAQQSFDTAYVHVRPEDKTLFSQCLEGASIHPLDVRSAEP